MLCSPRSRMDVLSEFEIDALIHKSKLAARYNRSIDTESAYEILSEKLEEAAEKAQEKEAEKQQAQEKKNAPKEKSFFDNPTVKQVERTAASILTRSLLGALGLGGRSSGSKKKSWF